MLAAKTGLLLENGITKKFPIESMRHLWMAREFFIQKFKGIMSSLHSNSKYIFSSLLGLAESNGAISFTVSVTGFASTVGFVRLFNRFLPPAYKTIYS